jgi:hypothetical protein
MNNDKQAREEISQRVAREQWRRLGRSIPKLFAYYRDLRRQGRDDESPFGASHKPNLERWRKEYKWDQWADELDRIEEQEDSKRYAQKRRRLLDSMTVLSDDAVATLNEIMNSGGVEPRVRLQAVALWLQYIAPKKVDSVEETTRELAPPPSITADPGEKIKWLQRVHDR